MDAKEFNEELIPVKALILYEGRRNSYTEARLIRKHGSQFQMGAGRPLLKSEAHDFYVKSARKDETFTPMKGVIPEGLLYYDEEKSWFLFEFKEKEYPITIRGKKEFKVSIPVNVLMLYKAGDIHICGRKGNKVYKIPFMNVDSEGNVCMGSASIKKKRNTFTHFKQQLFHAFFKSLFTEYRGHEEVWQDAEYHGKIQMKDLQREGTFNQYLKNHELNS